MTPPPASVMLVIWPVALNVSPEPDEGGGSCAAASCWTSYRPRSGTAAARAVWPWVGVDQDRAGAEPPWTNSTASSAAVTTAKCAAHGCASAESSIGVTADGEVSHDAWLLKRPVPAAGNPPDSGGRVRRLGTPGLPPPDTPKGESMMSP